MSIGGSKSKSKESQSQNFSQTSSTSYNPEFMNQLQDRITETSGREYQTLDPAAYEQYMNPYQSEVIDATTADINANRALAKTQLQADQAGAKAFGNDRRGIYEAELEGQYDRTLASTLSALRSQGYTQAQDIAQRENTNRTGYEAQQDSYVNQLLALLAQGNQTTRSSGSSSGTRTGSQSGFGFKLSAADFFPAKGK